MYNIADPKLIHSNFPGQISAKETAYRKAVDELVEKVVFMSNVLSFLESEICMNAYFTRGQELYFSIIHTEFHESDPVIHQHSFRYSEDKNLDTFSSAMNICREELPEKYPAHHVAFLKHLNELEGLYLNVIATHEAL